MQTAIKQRPILFSTPMVRAILEERKKMTRRIVKDNVPLGNWEETMKKCPYGNVGDILWVRETYIKCITWDGEGECPPAKYIYRADDKGPVDWHNEKTGEPGNIPWKPSIFMPKEACRIFLRITDIQVERLQNISEEDAVAEGIRQYPSGEYQFYMKDKLQSVRPGCDLARISFCSLWESINGAESWNTNPFVWVVNFERIDKPD